MLEHQLLKLFLALPGVWDVEFQGLTVRGKSNYFVIGRVHVYSEIVHLKNLLFFGGRR